ncbi:MAG: serine/threonine-protein kinase [Methylacidiphilales bacterium]|nr:serine/threonine-protein kinase [Candidatus Methylacidiphilales bacterium]
MINNPQFGKYHVLEKIGKGAMGEVWLAKDPDINRAVAIKTILKNENESQSNLMYEDMLARFKNEARIAALCSHPSMVTIYELNVQPPTPYLVMEYVSGKGLRDLIKEKSLSLREVNSIFHQLLMGVSAFHDTNIVHRDLKPGNIIVTEKLLVKITDFGIALNRNTLVDLEIDEGVPTHELTKIGTTVGTPRYMPIEQTTDSKVDQRADLYALTVMLYDLLCNCKLPSGIAYTTLQEQPQLFYTHQSVKNDLPIPVAFASLLLKGLAINVNQRIAHAEEYLSLYKHSVETFNIHLKEIRKKQDMDDISILTNDNFHSLTFNSPVNNSPSRNDSQFTDIVKSAPALKTNVERTMNDKTQVYQQPNPVEASSGVEFYYRNKVAIFSFASVLLTLLIGTIAYLLFSNKNPVSKAKTTTPIHNTLTEPTNKRDKLKKDAVTKVKKNNKTKNAGKKINNKKVDKSSDKKK